MLVILIHDSCLLINVVSVICYSYDHKFIIQNSPSLSMFQGADLPTPCWGVSLIGSFQNRAKICTSCMLSSIGNSESETPKFGINTLDLPPKPVTVTTRIITFLVESL